MRVIPTGTELLSELTKVWNWRSFCLWICSTSKEENSLLLRVTQYLTVLTRRRVAQTRWWSLALLECVSEMCEYIQKGKDEKIYLTQMNYSKSFTMKFSWNFIRKQPFSGKRFQHPIVNFTFLSRWHRISFTVSKNFLSENQHFLSQDHINSNFDWNFMEFLPNFKCFPIYRLNFPVPYHFSDYFSFQR